MSCSEIREGLSARTDGVVESGEAERLREHLEGCESCRAFEAELAATVELIREVPRPEAPEGFKAEVLDALPPSRGRHPILRFAPLLAAAALLIIGAAGFLSGPGDSDRGTYVANTPEREAGRGFAKESGSPDSTLRKQADAGGKLERPGRFEEMDQGLVGSRSRPQPRAVTEVQPLTERTAKELDEQKLRDVAAGVGGGASAPAPAPAPEPAGPEGKPRSRPSSGLPPKDDAVGDREEGGELELIAECRYLVAGVEPDTAAGVFIAELNARRSRAKAKKASSEEARLEEAPDRDEWVESDKSGEPESLHLRLTQGEFRYLAKLVERMRGAVLERINGHRGSTFGQDEGETPAGEKSGVDDTEGTKSLRRVSVELRLARAR